MRIDGDVPIVALNLPWPYATGNEYPGGVFRISVDRKTLLNAASFSYRTETNNRIPTTLVAGVPLVTKNQTVQALWQSERGSTVILDSPSTFHAIY